MILDDDGLAPLRARVPAHEIGQPLDDLSIEELAERIEMLRAEIARLDAKRQSKEASRAGAEAFFKA
jgi:uncharacterized small protein (DUF1192 family)